MLSGVSSELTALLSSETLRGRQRSWRLDEKISDKYLQEELLVSGAEETLQVHQALLHPLVRREDQVVVQLGVGLHPGGNKVLPFRN